MKNKLALATLALISSSAFGITNGTFVEPLEYPSLVQSNCTGTVIANKWILTAAHCVAAINNTSFYRYRTDGRHSVFSVDRDNLVVHPNNKTYNPNYSEDALNDDPEHHQDIALFPIIAGYQYPINKVLFLSDEVLHETHGGNGLTASFVDGIDLTKLGYGGTGSDLYSGEFGLLPTGPENFDDYYFGYNAPNRRLHGFWYIGNKTVAEGGPGDSGGPNLFNGKIVALTSSGSAMGDVWPDKYQLSFVEPIYQSRHFLLETINDWHYATELTAEVGETYVIELQSLHVDTLAPTYFEHTTNVVIDEYSSSCLNRTVEPFDICELALHVTDLRGAQIEIGGSTLMINYDSTGRYELYPEENTSSGSSSGSFGFAALGLLAAGLYRRRQF